MKTLYNIFKLAAAFALLVFITSCGDNTPGPDRNPVMRALVNSQNWQSTQPSAILTDNNISIYGTSSGGQTIQLLINGTSKGEYQLGMATGHEAKFYPNMASGTVAFSTASSEQGIGVVDITSINEEARTMSGKFYFTGYRETDNASRRITDGSFSNVDYRYIHDGDTSTFSNLFTCQIDGNNWVPTNVSALKGDSIVITANNTEDAEIIRMILPSEIGAGINPVSSDGPVYIFFEPLFHSFKAHSGSVTVTQHSTEDKHIKGNFFFNFVNNNDETISVDVGLFDVKYTLE